MVLINNFCLKLCRLSDKGGRVVILTTKNKKEGEIAMGVKIQTTIATPYII